MVFGTVNSIETLLVKHGFASPLLHKEFKRTSIENADKLIWGIEKCNRHQEGKWATGLGLC
jgi:hypothetical protein